MLPKKNRADKNTIEKVFKEGKFINSPNLTFKFILSGDLSAQKISVVAPKSVAKLATGRNSLRRRGYNILKKHIAKFPLGIKGALVFKKHQEDSQILENEIKNILTKIN